MAYYMGIDLGGTKIYGLILEDTHPEPIIQKKVSTEGHEGVDGVLKRIAQLCQQLCDEASLSLDDIVSIGLGVPATIDYDKGETLLLPNIPGDWWERPVEAELEALLHTPIWLINDARAFTLAESNLGAGKDYEVVACFTLGTGIGGGIAINNKLHMGLSGNAGEFGHSTVHVDGPPDGSGTPGTIEVYGSGPAIATAGIKAVIQGIDTIIGKLADNDLNQITPRTVMQAAQGGDEVALRILADAGKHIGAGVANVVTILAPHCIVFGGGVAALGKWILDPIKRSMAIYNHTIDLSKVAIKTAELGDDAGAIGAALWAKQREDGTA